VYVDLGNAASQWGNGLYVQLSNAVEAIANDIVRNGKINRDAGDDAQGVNFGRCTFEIEPGMSTYSSKTCVFCCNCSNNMNAVRFYLAWRLDCRSDEAKALALVPEIPRIKLPRLPGFGR
jgi:hypothetical protein